MSQDMYLPIRVTSPSEYKGCCLVDHETNQLVFKIKRTLVVNANSSDIVSARTKVTIPNGYLALLTPSFDMRAFGLEADKSIQILYPSVQAGDEEVRLFLSNTLTDRAVKVPRGTEYARLTFLRVPKIEPKYVYTEEE